jgi:hypothetical protein
MLTFVSIHSPRKAGADIANAGGNFGHAGRPGQRGGSAPGSGGAPNAHSLSMSANHESLLATDKASHDLARSAHLTAAKGAADDDTKAYHTAMAHYHETASMGAHMSEENVKGADEVKGHDAAAAEHQRLAKYHEDHGNAADAVFHRDMAAYHSKVYSEKEAPRYHAEQAHASAVESGKEGKPEVSAGRASKHAEAASAIADKSGRHSDHAHAARAHSSAREAWGGFRNYLTETKHHAKKSSDHAQAAIKSSTKKA